MNYEIICDVCGHSFWTRGIEEYDTNAFAFLVFCQIKGRNEC